ncbi:MAG: spore coat protein YlbD [Bacilli bacterium]|nr:spore coat protein YlbD [Bacilli bacterium]
MDKLENFKEFVKDNPGLIKYVKSNEMTWQKFYELYDLYGKEDNIWKPYIGSEILEDNATRTATAATAAFGVNDVVNWFKNIDVNTLQSGINSVQRVVGVLQDFTSKEKTETPKEEYRPRPLYKHFED